MTQTTVLTIPGGAPPPEEVLESAIAALAAGEVVALPTETVYGLAVRADSAEGLARLVSVKGSEDGRPFTLHVGAPTDGEDGIQKDISEAAALPNVVGRLRERYWPGPLTLVLRADTPSGAFDGIEGLCREGWTGVRAPAHPVTRAVLGAAPFPVVATSANAAGGDPALDAQAVRAAFGPDEVPLVLDAGRSTLGQASTVLAVGPGRFEVLREGIVSGDELRRTAGLSILFVCTGNTCRSPMAEALARRAIRAALDTEDESEFGFSVASAGVFAGPGSPASENSIRALDELGVDLSGHRSQPVIDRDVMGRDRVFCLTSSHRDALLAMLPPSAASAVELLDPRGRDLSDPFGGPIEVYRSTRDAIAECIQQRVREWI